MQLYSSIQLAPPLPMMGRQLLQLFLVLLCLVNYGLSSTDCSHPTFCDSDSQCVETCPQGTFGAVDRSDNTTMRRCSTCDVYNIYQSKQPQLGVEYNGGSFNSLECFATDISESVDVTTILPNLISHGLLTPEQRDSITHPHHTSTKKQEELCRILLNLNERCVKKFLQSLSETSNYDPHKQLLNKIQYDSGDSTSGSFSVIIVIAAAVGAFILILLVVVCCILILLHRRKTNKGAKLSKPTLIMEDITSDSLFFTQGAGDPKMQETAEDVTAQGTEGASDESKKDLLGEAHLLSQFNHPNVLTLLGVVTVDEPVMVIIPFMKNGDLHSFLTRMKRTDDKAKLSCASKLDMAIQIANGMEYLAAKFYVHRDLAARNILIGEGFHVKISDFGMSRALAKEDTYYKVNRASKLPLKWMSIESIYYAKFSTFSDVWSFGVVLWEIFSYGRNPYKEISNAKLPAHLRSGKRLTKPADCSDEIYQLMSQCWLERKERRPTFTELKKEISVLLDKEGSKPGEYVYII